LLPEKINRGQHKNILSTIWRWEYYPPDQDI